MKCVQVTCRRAKLSNLATFKVMGGTGGVIYGHQVHHMKDIVAADAIAPQTRFA